MASEELHEARKFMELSKFPRLKSVLAAHIAMIEKEDMDVDPPQAPESSETTASKPVIPSKPTPKPQVASGAKFVPIEDISWDQGEYGSPHITIYVDIPGVIEAKDRVECKFGQWSLDLSVMDLKGKNYRLVKDNLEKDILPDKSSFKVKNNKVVIKLAKKKGEFSYDQWNNLTSKKKREAGDNKKGANKEDPMGGIMDMMKNLYDEGDDSTRKAIGEAMLKSRSGEAAVPPDMSDMEM